MANIEDPALLGRSQLPTELVLSEIEGILNHLKRHSLFYQVGWPSQTFDI